PRLPEMALERGDRVAAGAIEITGYRNGIAELGEQPLQFLDRWMAVAEHIDRAWLDRRRLDPQPDPGAVQGSPGKFLPRVAFAGWGEAGRRGRGVGVSGVRGEVGAAQACHRRDLPQREFRIAVVVPGIGHLDADGRGVDVGLAGPERPARMPGAARFGHALN